METQTDRLRLRPPLPADVSALFEFLGDPEAMRHTHCDGSLRQCRRRIALHERQRRADGVAPWTVITKQDGRIVGWGGLYNDPFDPGWGVEIGYHFRHDVWGRGYATELVSFCNDLADGALALPEVRAFARRENAASLRVLEKSGFEVMEFVPAMDRLLLRRRRKGLPA